MKNASPLLLVLGSAMAFTSSNNNNLAQRTQTVHLSLWGEPSEKDGEDGDKSIALPFATRPKLLDGTMAGDVGFDPFGFAGADKANLTYMREAEIKHSRLAMLAVVGWPLAELWDKPLADAAGLPTLLTSTGESPSLLNGGLSKVSVAYWVAVASLAGIIELESSKMQEEKGKDYLPGDCNFDPLNLLPTDKKGQKEMMTKEIKHGRIAMMAVLGFAIQEAVYNVPVVAETPMFFKPMF
mmetsp:Transcript_44746/g.50170  ORF Transcript_44746/g.50170 Transcript_44746/m.50170 type:complete len:239 (-) Transcript_44746:91-807(-)|eukprot:CAMPEP_0170789376 /NCGR_PEP_ID=MMETSP0733-20121128/19661_1 /TAXON_ID=186038 /ORGANISM="Fragilariopsis kerguelensis, Strain L26-C5" /LENGTH=238 /DNA_ID=CAMNT_0011136401 /DNA_START=268 /DNA_END=984 /DNA_ORIENTATION=+